jgi:hypothetical protein
MALSFWRFFHEGHGTINIDQQFPDGIVEHDSMVVASISELIDVLPPTKPHMSAAHMSVLNVAPQSGSKVLTRVKVESSGKLKFQVAYHIETPPRPGNISLDCTALSHTWLTLLPQKPGPLDPARSTNPLASHPDSGGWFYCKNRKVDFNLPDGLYNVTVQSGTYSLVFFTVTGGIISYDPALQARGIVQGAGTNTLVLKGRHVSIDTTAAANDLVYLPGVNDLDGRDLVNIAKTTFCGNLLPTSHNSDIEWEYGFMIGSGVAGTFTFRLLLDGTITYRDEFLPHVTGRGTNSLKIKRFV